ncbi:hemolysin III family protein [Alginatibacterium sediminis]|uniref:Hemolysin III family protein n=1 Tax=Alginatibacterium sediminis TaxID=2164068 RepID=A0A420EGC9_9ALTE|nr:hemolysin III family protein [Alginatibacterium sediminis]RKF19714.1 hemolysin III family protein [Alginatibacterium sediminis]
MATIKKSIPQLAYNALEERLNSSSHGLGFLLAVVGLLFLITKAEGALEITAVSIYGGSLILMFLASCIYHTVADPVWKQRLKLLDHSAIYILIAGTYTPILMIAFDGWVSWASMLAIWSLAAFGVAFKLLTQTRFPKVSLSTYLGMGWFSVLLAYPLYQNVASAGLYLLAAGGLMFSIGVLFYVAKHKPYTHAIWHLFVIAGCSFHFASVYHYVV